MRVYRKLPALVVVPLVAALIWRCSRETPVAPTSGAAGLIPSFSAAASEAAVVSGMLFSTAPEVNATGKARIICVDKGTLYVVHLTGLVPKRVYTLWGFTATGRGALGAADGSENFFTSSASGEGQLSLLVPPGGRASFTGVWPECALTSRSPAPRAFFLILDGHTDNQTHGGVPFPNNYDVMRFPN